jgi:hypothetical protein
VTFHIKVLEVCVHIASLCAGTDLADIFAICGREVACREAGVVFHMVDVVSPYGDGARCGRPTTVVMARVLDGLPQVVSPGEADGGRDMARVMSIDIQRRQTSQGTCG